MNNEYNEYDNYSEDLEDEDVYDGYSEEGESKGIKGITDTVTDYTYTSLSYPCLIILKNVKLEKHKVLVLSNMVKSKITGVDKDITLYFTNTDGQLYKLGMVGGVHAMPIIDLVGRENLTAFMQENKELTGSLIYTLCSF